MAAKKRARSDTDKLKRKDNILKAAWGLYNKNGQISTVAEVAKQARLSKGSIYLYFKNKEEIYLQLFIEKIKQWMVSGGVIRIIETGAAGMSVDEVSSLVTQYIRENPLILKLGNIVVAHLEDNRYEDIIIATKLQIAEVLMLSRDMITTIYPQIHPQEAMVLMLQSYSIITGLWQFNSSPEHIRKIIRERGVDVFDIDFSDIVRKSVSALLKATLNA